jgi:hypothetical protein
MSHFARKILGPEPVKAVTQPQFQVRPSLRLRIWVRGQLEEHQAGTKGWLPVLVAGTAWDEDQLRTQYKARGVCTFWIKVGLEKDAA